MMTVLAEDRRSAWNALPVPGIAEVFDVAPNTPRYQHVHKWIKRMFRRAGRCEWCGTTKRRTVYANARSDGYTYNRADWLELCDRCHVHFDGRTGPGEKNPRAKLTEDDVRQIRELRATGVTIAALGLRFGVSHVLISRIARRKSWVHVT